MTSALTEMGSDESYFHVSVGSDGQSHKTVSTNHNLSEEEGEPKRYRTEVLPLTSFLLKFGSRLRTLAVILVLGLFFFFFYRVKVLELIFRVMKLDTIRNKKSGKKMGWGEKGL